MDKSIDQKRIAVWRLFLAVHASVIKALEREMEEEQGLPLTWYDILTHLDYAPEGRLRMQTLASRILLSRSGLTRLVERMERAGLVQRELCLDDRRGCYTFITNEGRQALRRVMPSHLRGIHTHFLQHVSEEHVQALFYTFAKVLQGNLDPQSAAYHLQGPGLPSLK